ncbi:hypothetical protein HK101_003108, partial [Irineochytrium annulatum]
MVEAPKGRSASRRRLRDGRGRVVALLADGTIFGVMGMKAYLHKHVVVAGQPDPNWSLILTLILDWSSAVTSRLPCPVLLRIAAVSREWRAIVDGHPIWRRLLEAEVPDAFAPAAADSEPLKPPRLRYLDWWSRHAHHSRLGEALRRVAAVNDAAASMASSQDFTLSNPDPHPSRPPASLIINSRAHDQLAAQLRRTIFPNPPENTRLRQSRPATLPASFARLYAIENIARILATCTPSRELQLVPISRLKCIPVPRTLEAMGKVLLLFLEEPDDEWGGMKTRWFAIFDPFAAQADCAVLSGELVFPDSTEEVERDHYVSPHVWPDHAHYEDLIAVDVEIVSPSLSDFIATLVEIGVDLVRNGTGEGAEALTSACN